MKLRYWFLITVLILATAAPIAYKTFVLGLDFFPKVKGDIWEIEFALKIPKSSKTKKYYFAIPTANDRLHITATQFEGENLTLTIDKTLEGTFAQLRGKSERALKMFYRVHVHSQDKEYEVPSRDVTQEYKEKVRPFLQPIPVSAGLEKEIQRLEEELFSGKRNKVDIIRNLYYFVYEEIVRSKKTLGPEKALLEFRGSSRDKAELFTLLARRQNVPARTLRGIILLEKSTSKRKLIYWNEVYLGGKWIPVFPAWGYFGRIRASYIPLFTSIEEETRVPINQGFKQKIYAERLASESFSTLQYRRELLEKDSALISFSPYMLPLTEQPIFKLLLLFTLGTVVLAFCRNVVGLKSFGIFFPILLSLFFKETSLAFGVGFYGFIVLLGLLERSLLQKMHLLAIPRFAIILTLLVMTLLIFAILNNQYHFSTHNPAILPIIITTMFIERFSIMWEEEGTLNTALALLGTLMIAVLSYLLFLWEDMERLLYTHPETLFAIIALLILIGKYTGYRFSELFRFREFMKK